jgi:PHD/YefM family antitoxin component YafN of YafNO toxin-antitoxin module
MALRKNLLSKTVKHRLGKAKAREQFAPLVELLATDGGTVEITDYGKVAAVMLGYKDYMRLVSKADIPLRSEQQLRGSASLLGDLEKATAEITKQVRDSVEKTVREL